MSRANTASPPLKRVRCAVYTRKSSDEGLDKEFNSLDAQREAGEAFVRSQMHEGWDLSAERYDDGGFTGGNIDRPALQRLMTDIAAGRIDCVVVYKVDRLSRSLLDFARLMDTFDAHGVAFVSVTQQFNTATSMGRLVLNVLLSFAQFEREIISERTRDKKAATARKGKWLGGPPVLGYDLDPRGGALVINPAEAEQVRGIYDLYLEHEALLPVLKEVTRRGWRCKEWTKRNGVTAGGNAFAKNTLHRLLTNVLYAGKIRYKQEIHPGVHAGIVDPGIWQQVQDRLEANNRIHGAKLPDRHGSLLKGLLRCGPCGSAMTPSTVTKATRGYRYYVCVAAQRYGRGTCPCASLPAGETERYVMEQIGSLAPTPDLPAETLAAFQSRWKTLDPRGQARTLRRLVDRIVHDGHAHTLAITLNADGFTAAAETLETPCPR